MQSTIKGMLTALLVASTAIFAGDVTLSVIQQFDIQAGADHQIHFADFDGDGNKDMIARYNDGSGMAVGVWLHDGTSFSTTVSTKIKLNVASKIDTIGQVNSTSGADQQIKFADMDGDGNLDMVAVGSGTTIEVRLGTTTGFPDAADAVIDIAGLVAPIWIGVGDFNDDTYGDVAIMQRYPGDSPPLVVYGAASWAASITTADVTCVYPTDAQAGGAYTFYGGYASVVTGDFNGDGSDDFSFSALDGAVAGGWTIIYRGGTSFDGVPDDVLAMSTSNAVALNDSQTVYPRWPSPMYDTGDFNGDGYDDIFTNGYYSYTNFTVPGVISGTDESISSMGLGMVYLGGPGLDAIPDAYMVAPNRFLAYQVYPTSWVGSGYRTYSLGDVNGDGQDELSMPSQYWDLNLVYAGMDTLTQAATIADAAIYREPLFIYSRHGAYNLAGYTDQHSSILVGIGDINNDGFDDFANETDYFNTGPDTQSVRIFYGSATIADSVVADEVLGGYTRVAPSNIDMDGDGYSEFVVADENYMITTMEVQSYKTSDMTWIGAGDYNNDGKADVSVLSVYGAYHAPQIVYGSATPPDSIQLADFRLNFPVDSDYLQMGNYTSIVTGDFNGDGVDDLMFPDQGTNTVRSDYGGRSLVYFGGSSMTGDPDVVLAYDGTVPVALTDSTNIYLRWFTLMPSMGDFNGDGYDDVFTGAYYSYTDIITTSKRSEDEQQLHNTGAAVVFFGGPAFDNIPDVIMVAPDEFIEWTTVGEYMYGGYRVYNAGDVDGDGTDDLSLPAQFWDVGMIYTGSTTLGQATSLATAVLMREPAHYFTKDRWDVNYYLDQHNANLVPIGDIDGDGLADLGNTRNYYGTGPDEPGIRLFASGAYTPGKLKPFFETAAYIDVQPSNMDFNGDGKADIVAHDPESNLVLLSAAVDYTNTPPEAVTLSSPADNAATDTLNLTFAWNPGSDYEGDTLTYTFNLSGARVDTSITGLTDTSVVFDGTGILVANQAYTWSVDVSDGTDLTVGTETRTITPSVGLAIVDGALIPEHYALSPNYPNPFNPSTTISFAMPEAAAVKLTVYDMLGREVAVLLNENRVAGYHKIIWNGLNNRGTSVGSGIYFCRIQTAAFSKTIKMAFVK